MSGRGRGGGRGRAMDLPSHPRGGPRGGFRGDRGSGDRGGGRGGFRGDRGGDRGGGRGGGGRGRGGGGGAPPPEVFRQNTSPQEDVSITKLEDATVATAKQALTPAGVKSISPKMPVRPNYGIKGKRVVLWANYFKMMPPGDLELYRYGIKVTNLENPSRPPTSKLIRRLIQLLLDEQFIPNNIRVATDFKSTLITRAKEKFESEYRVILRSEGEDQPSDNAPQFRLAINPTGSLTVSELIDYLTSTRASEVFDHKDEIILALNIVLGHHPKASSSIANVGGNRHFSKEPSNEDQLDLGAGLTAIRGFLVSVRAATTRVLLNVQVKNMAFYNAGNLVGLIDNYWSENGRSLPKLAKFLKKVNVDRLHLVDKNKAGQRIPKIKTIWGLAMKDDGRKEEHPPRVPAFGAGPKNVLFWLKSSEKDKTKNSKTAKDPPAGPSGGKKGKKGGAKPGQSSSTDDGRYISVFDFFQQAYGKTLNCPDYPVVNVGSRDKPVYLPPEVCEVVPGQPADAKLSSRQTQNMIRFAVRRPHLNATSIVTKGNNMLGLNPSNDTLTGFGINVTPQMVAVPGRVLNGPDVLYARGKITPRFASWNLQGVKFATQTSLPNWVYLRIAWDGQPMLWQGPQAMTHTIQAFQNKLKEIGVNAGSCNGGLTHLVTLNDFESQIDEAINRFANPGEQQQRPHLIFVIIPERDNTAIYNRVKYNCDVKHGFLNFCVVDSKFYKANEQYYANVGLKFNLKLGGRNHNVQPTDLGFVKDKKTMIVGIDVTHPSPGSSKNAPSVAGIVASVDATLSQWPADIRAQTGRQEMVDALDQMFEGRLRLWQKHNKTLPENIIVYRDGVSEGQYESVLTQELDLLQKTCKRLYSNATQPKMTILVVGKRHHTRFYVADEKNMDRSGNPTNGTVVERGITESRNWDFFMQAHTALQGTARPAHYYVIYDQIFRERQALNPSGYNATQELQDLTHNMCYLFGRATKAVSICPPAYYADLVCERARCYLSGLFEPSPVTSPTGSVASVAVPSEDIHSGVRIHERVKDTMFYV